jgi:hypothetical protein
MTMTFKSQSDDDARPPLSSVPPISPTREEPPNVTEVQQLPIAPPSIVRVPQHVVYREFVAETVVLNLNTGIYHGLNPTAGRMLKLIDELGDLGEVASRLANEYRVPRSEIAADLADFCRDLLDRDLIAGS